MTGFTTMVLASAIAGSMVSAQITGDMLAKVATGNNNCVGADQPDQCVPNAEVAPFLEASFMQYGICSKNVQAAVTSLMAFESGSWKYKENMFPGRPGQGTANMQMPEFNAQYMDTIPELKGKWNAADLDGSLKLLMDNKYNFGSGGWYLTTHQACVDTKVMDTLRADPDAGWKAYMGCVGVDAADAQRLALWTAAKEAFGVQANELDTPCSGGATTGAATGAAAPNAAPSAGTGSNTGIGSNTGAEPSAATASDSGSTTPVTGAGAGDTNPQTTNAVAAGQSPSTLTSAASSIKCKRRLSRSRR